MYNRKNEITYIHDFKLFAINKTILLKISKLNNFLKKYAIFIFYIVFLNIVL